MLAFCAPPCCSLDFNALCGINQYGQGTYTAEGITKLAEALKSNSSLRELTCDLLTLVASNSYLTHTSVSTIDTSVQKQSIAHTQPSARAHFFLPCYLFRFFVSMWATCSCLAAGSCGAVPLPHPLLALPSVVLAGLKATILTTPPSNFCRSAQQQPPQALSLSLKSN